MQRKKIKFELELYLRDEVKFVTVSKYGQILTFSDNPSLHSIVDWSNQWEIKNCLTVSNYKNTKISVK